MQTRNIFTRSFKYFGHPRAASIFSNPTINKSIHARLCIYTLYTKYELAQCITCITCIGLNKNAVSLIRNIPNVMNKTSYENKKSIKLNHNSTS